MIDDVVVFLRARYAEEADLVRRTEGSLWFAKVLSSAPHRVLGNFLARFGPTRQRLAILAGQEVLERFETLDKAVGAEEESRDRELEAKYDEAWLAVMREARRYQWHDGFRADWEQAYEDEMTYEQRLLA